MCIKYHPERKVFELATLHTSYQIQISELGHLIHLYYGAAVNDLMDYLFEPLTQDFRQIHMHRSFQEAGLWTCTRWSAAVSIAEISV